MKRTPQSYAHYLESSINNYWSLLKMWLVKFTQPIDETGHCLHSARFGAVLNLLPHAAATAEAEILGTQSAWRVPALSVLNLFQSIHIILLLLANLLAVSILDLWQLPHISSHPFTPKLVRAEYHPLSKWSCYLVPNVGFSWKCPLPIYSF